jgi:hypothetical protein
MIKLENLFRHPSCDRIHWLFNDDSSVKVETGISFFNVLKCNYDLFFKKYFFLIYNLIMIGGIDII